MTFGLLGSIVGWSRHALVISCAISVVVCTFLSPLFGLCLSSVAIMLDADLPSLAVVPGYASIAKVLAIITALSLLVHLIVKQNVVERLRAGFRSTTLRWYAFLGLWPFILVPVAMGSWYDQFVMLSIQVSMVGMVVLFGTIPRNFRELQVIVFGICIGAAILGIYTVAYGLPTAADTARLEGSTHGQYNYSMARGMAIALIMSIIPMRLSGWLMRSTLIATDVVLCLIIYFTLSRSTYVGLVGAMLLTPFMVPRIPFRYRVGYLCIAATLGATAIYILHTGILGDFWTLFVARADSAIDAHESSQRIEYVWPASLAFIKDHMLIGGGPGAQFALGLWAHNMILQVGMESGLIGLIFLALFLVATMREAARNSDPVLRLCSLSLITFWMIAGQFGNPLFSQSFAVSVGVLACMANLGMCPRKGQLPYWSLARQDPTKDSVISTRYKPSFE